MPRVNMTARHIFGLRLQPRLSFGTYSSYVLPMRARRVTVSLAGQHREEGDAAVLSSWHRHISAWQVEAVSRAHDYR